MNNRDFSRELEKRTKQFALQILKISATLPTTPEGIAIRKQISRSGSSVGANYREANRARSKADFKNKIGICESEASETVYWLELILESGIKRKEKLNGLYREANEILAIFTSIGKSLKY